MSFRCRLSVTCLVVWFAFSAASLFSQSTPSSHTTPPRKATSSALPTKTLTDAQMSQMSTDDLAKYVFQEHGCKNCHTLGKAGRLGLTERGIEIGKSYEGCVSLLTSMNLIAQRRDAERSADKKTAARFREFGCTACHQIVTRGGMGLTSYGAKLKSMHMACTDVERLLSQQR